MYQGCINGLVTNSRSLSLISTCLLYVKCLCDVLINPFVYNYIIVLVCFQIFVAETLPLHISERCCNVVATLSKRSHNVELLAGRVNDDNENITVIEINKDMNRK